MNISSRNESLTILLIVCIITKLSSVVVGPTPVSTHTGRWYSSHLAGIHARWLTGGPALSIQPVGSPPPQGAVHKSTSKVVCLCWCS